ncbi:mannose-1-phosphate guanylyltransferase/mannose-6-phosphate isomerase [Candidatus Puniceispirillum sp.]|nr:mannose-1-phosphate guanylyltransferase/mannose-6-phosphate isomerase [Candidatus Puniceispirillum sp.]
MQNIIPVVLSGGVGARLWPLSRQSFPKQFTKLIDEVSLFQAAVQRATFVSKIEPVVVTSSGHRYIVQNQLNGLGVRAQILLEPKGKNTAPAVFAATHFVSGVHGDALVLIMPSDHHIPDERAFAQMVQSGCAAAMDGALVTFGIKPHKPETGYGYIELGDIALGNCYAVNKFLEKPSLEVVEQIFASENHVWNAGIFLFKASTLKSLAQRFEPEMYNRVVASVDAASQENNFWHIDPSYWAHLEGQSIDYAILERCDEIKCLKFAGCWSDLGDWNALASQLPLDTSENLISGGVTQFDCNNTTLWAVSERTHLVGLGLKNIVAVVTDDAVLVADANCVQDVRYAVDCLAEKKVLQASQHSKYYRPWGWFESLVNKPGYQVKRLNIYPKAAISLQSHQHRSEHWVVVCGTATVTLDGVLMTIETNASVYIEAGQKHRLANGTNDPLVVIEVQTGGYLGEDDIIRYEDFYNRAQEINADN